MPSSQGSLQGHLPGQRLLYGHVCGIGDGGEGGKACAKWQATNYGYCVGGGFGGVCLCVSVNVCSCTRTPTHTVGPRSSWGDRVSKNEQSHPCGNTTPRDDGREQLGSQAGGVASTAQWLWLLPGPPSHLLTKREEVPALAGTETLQGTWAHWEKAATPQCSSGRLWEGSVCGGPWVSLCLPADVGHPPGLGEK